MTSGFGIGISSTVCVVFSMVFLLCYIKSKGRYDEYIQYVDQDEYGLKDLIPLGLWIMESQAGEKILPMPVREILAHHKNQVYQKILELRGTKNVEFYRYIHDGYRMAIGIIGAAGISIVGMIISIQGDVASGLLLSGGAAITFFGVPFLVDTSLNDQIEKRRRTIQMEFPEFVNKLTLLVNAGMTISKAWEKIINENKKNHLLYDEMRYALMEIRAGKPEAVAYEEFARRCRVKEVTKFVSIIVMNLKRGGADVVPVLREQGNECWEMRKNAAKQIGEEAGTKILIPMMIMFLGIVLVVSTPAVLGMTAGM